MKNEYLLQHEFTNWLHLKSDLLCYKPLFYSTQINNLNRLSVFNSNGNCLFDNLENDLICNNADGVEAIVLNTLDRMEQREIQNKIKIKALEGLRIGLLQYRSFLHHFISKRNINFISQNRGSNYFSDIKRLPLEALFKGNTRYSLPIYQDVYTYNKSEIDDLWHVLLNDHSDKKIGAKEEHSVATHDLGSLIVTKRGEKHLEVVDGGQTLIILSLLIHVLRAFSQVEKGVSTSEIEFKNLGHFIKFTTGLNDQIIFRVLVSNGINKRATRANEISKGILYKYEEPGLNMGYHFLQTTFRFVQLVQASKIPQSERYIVDINDFVDNILKNNSLKLKRLSHQNSDKTYLDSNTLLMENIMEWL